MYETVRREKESGEVMNRIIQGDALEVLKKLPDESINMVMTSPPYWALRDYGIDGQLGLEPTFQEYIEKLCNMFDEVKRVLKKDGTCWVNIGDTYGTQSGAMRDGKFGEKNTNNQQMIQPPGKHKSLSMIPARFAIEMIERGWILRNTVIWHKPNCMPESVKDRFTNDYEYLFFFVKNKKYWFEAQYDNSVRDWANTGGSILNDTAWHKGAHGKDRKRYKPVSDTTKRNKRSVWTIPTKPFTDAHFAVYPEALCVTPIKAGCPEGGVVLDPFFGSGTTGVVARKLGRNYIGIDLNPEYIKIAERRLAQQVLL